MLQLLGIFSLSRSCHSIVFNQPLEWVPRFCSYGWSLSVCLSVCLSVRPCEKCTFGRRLRHLENVFVSLHIAWTITSKNTHCFVSGKEYLFYNMQRQVRYKKDSSLGNNQLVISWWPRSPARDRARVCVCFLPDLFFILRTRERSRDRGQSWIPTQLWHCP